MKFCIVDPFRWAALAGKLFWLSGECEAAFGDGGIILEGANRLVNAVVAVTAFGLLGRHVLGCESCPEGQQLHLGGFFEEQGLNGCMGGGLADGEHAIGAQDHGFHIAECGCDSTAKGHVLDEEGLGVDVDLMAKIGAKTVSDAQFLCRAGKRGYVAGVAAGNGLNVLAGLVDSNVHRDFEWRTAAAGYLLARCVEFAQQLFGDEPQGHARRHEDAVGARDAGADVTEALDNSEVTHDAAGTHHFGPELGCRHECHRAVLPGRIGSADYSGTVEFSRLSVNHMTGNGGAGNRGAGRQADSATSISHQRGVAGPRGFCVYFILTLVTPVFGLIALGYLAGRFGVIGEAGRKGLADFAFTLAIPALLFHRMATAEFPATPPLGLWASFFGAALATGFIGLVVATRGLGRTGPDGVAIAMSSMFANIVMLGIPIALARYGDPAVVALAFILLLQPPLMWLTGLTAMGIADQAAHKGWRDVARDLAGTLFRNPVVLGTVCGAIWGFTGLGLLAPVDKLLGLLAQAGVPTALVALGLSLTQFQVKGQTGSLAMIVTLKLLVMPALAWLLAARVFGLSPVETGVVTLLAAMPTGANAFLFASRFGTAVNSASGAVALGTMLAALTITLLLLAL